VCVFVFVCVSRADICSTEGHQGTCFTSLEPWFEVIPSFWGKNVNPSLNIMTYATYVSVHIPALRWQISWQAPWHQISKQSDQPFPNAYVRTGKYGEVNRRIFTASLSTNFPREPSQTPRCNSLIIRQTCKEGIHEEHIVLPHTQLR